MSESDSSTLTKVCTKCGRERPATLEYFCREKAGKYGLRSRCKTCAAARHADYRAEHRDDAAAYRATHRDETAAYNAAHYAEHRDEVAAYGAVYYAAHREEIAAYRAAYYAEHREEKAAYGAAHRDERAAYCAEHREEFADYSRKYYAAYRPAHRDEAAVYRHNRRALEANATGTHTAADVRAQYARQNGRCIYCHEKVGDTYHRDHVIPLVLGGSNGPENIVIACPTCNLSKGAKHPQEFCGRLL